MACNACPSNIRDRRKAIDCHEQICLRQYGSQDVDDSRGAAKSQTVGVGASDTNGCGPKRQRLDYVSPGSDTGIEQHGCLARCCNDRWQHVDCGNPAICLASAVVRAIDRIDPAVDCAFGIIGVTNPFQD